MPRSKFGTRQLIELATEFMAYTGTQTNFAHEHDLSVSFVNKLSNLCRAIRYRNSDWLDKELKTGRITKQMHWVGSTAISMLLNGQL